MATKHKQFRFYSNSDSTHNSPAHINYQNLVSGKVFASYVPIRALGIQSLPGTQFYLNASTEPIIVGTTGVYDLDLGGNTEITSLSFSGNSLLAIINSPTAGLIIDIDYEDNGGTN